MYIYYRNYVHTYLIRTYEEHSRDRPNVRGATSFCKQPRAAGGKIATRTQVITKVIAWLIADVIFRVLFVVWSAP
jgi:hypothetical protein